MSFYQKIENMLSIMTNLKGFEFEELNSVLAELCMMFRLSKGVVRFYQGLNFEMQDKGDQFVCYDNGMGGSEVHRIRIVTNINAVVTCTVYMTDDEEPLTPEEFEKVDLVMKIVLSFACRVRLQNVVEMLAFHDDSGFYNLRFFLQNLQQRNGKNQLGGKVAIHFNLRHFSLVNQEIGKDAGDVVMRNYYDGLSKLIGSRGVVCRLGGDNFVALCEQPQLDEVIGYLEGAPVPYDTGYGSRIMVSASAGIFQIPADFQLHNPGEIMDKIITTSQAARSGNGTKNIRYFTENLLSDKERIMRVQQRFPDALKNEEFQVHYQPKIDLQTGALAGAEALCRWVHKGEMIMPGAFIPVLERTTDICRLDFYMLEHVCRDLRQWLDEGRDVVRISVNLSRRHMMDVDLLNTILEIIDRYEVPHKYLEVELTETTTDVEFKDLKRVVGGLQRAGIYTSVDDFGVGYSSLNLIREIPWNVLKLDRSLLPDDDDHDSARSVMFRHVIAMAKEMGLSCIAEGVETQAQVDMLRASCCGMAQGFFFDRVLSKEVFEEKLCGFHYEVK